MIKYAMSLHKYADAPRNKIKIYRGENYEKVN